MSKFMRHTGTNHLGSKVVIVFRELPDDPNSCLVVESQTLNEMYHDQLMRVLESSEAQSELDLYTVLQRRNFGDGQVMLNALHGRGLLKKMPVEKITVSPMPNRTAPLSEVNKAIRENKMTPQEKQARAAQEKATAESAPVTEPVVDGEQKPEQPPVGSDEQKRSLAETKLLTARMMEDDAKKLRDEAYQLDPSLKKGGRPSKDQKKKADTLTATEAE